MRTTATLLAACLVLPGCIYSHVTRPFDLNVQADPVSTNGDLREGHRSTKHVSFNSLRVEWGNSGLGEIARRFGLETIHYADVEELRVLGVWRREYIHLYGE